ncbi:hypothetical protein BJ684DRAFT_20486 [Piptocephalis cylindrospora]|uniref:Uncharacterized protein n=1 Tax=Piptocephalis cylindrospora TaxID=1907219 RepID=A0A4P9Y2K0_9FUNG|nr:hypothetical protein BJ684DRAFT_20486 [Piptocephalis cylindrospora]|eukprot:RKP13003.1 hypothetical protein BJ684DRAFT_20486 [Piptocephalis cylindrospora]
MDLTKDSLYDWDNPANTPCRWSGNIHNCRDSEFFQIVTFISIGFSALLPPTVIYLLSLSRIRGWMWLQPWKWNTANIYYGCNGWTGLFFVLYDVIVYVDVPGPYWPRHLLFGISFSIFLSGIVPFLHTLTAPAALSLSSEGGSETPKPPLTHRIVQILPLLILLGLMFAIVRAVGMDHEMDVLADVFTSLCLGIYCVSTLLIAYTCCYHGSRFFSLLNAKILTVEGNTVGGGNSKSKNFVASPPPPESRAYRSLGRSISTMHLNDQPQSDGKDAAVCENSGGKSLTAIEARAALRKITYVNVLMFMVAAGGCVFTFLMTIMPSKIFTIMALSKLTYTFLQAGVPALLEAIVMANIITELRRRKSFHDYHNTPDISLVDQARTIHQTIILSQQKGPESEVGVASSRLQGRAFDYCSRI